MSGPSRSAPAPTSLVDRGQVQYSTTYNPGDVVLLGGRRVLITTLVTTGSGTNGTGEPFISAANYTKLAASGSFYAADYGVVGDGATDNWAALQRLLILVRSLTTNSSNGYKVILPSGVILVSKTVIVPTQTMLVGQGLYSTTIKIMVGANCDVVQPERFNNSAQATALTTLSSGLTAGNLRNAYRWGLQDLTVHGNSGTGGTINQSLTAYYHGVNVQPNPLITTGTGDPDFDPAAILSNVQARSCTGDGFYADGRSAMRMTNCVAWFNYGNGFTPSFDTQHSSCQAGFNGLAGFYVNHQTQQASGNKSYNNGQQVKPWATGLNWTVGQRSIYNGVVYAALNALTAASATPNTDPTNWGVITTTSPQAWGVGVYFDTNAGESTFDCDCQQNSASNWYFKGTTDAIHASGCSDEPNFDNVGTSGVLTTNPNNYAAVVLDGAHGVVASIGTRLVGTAGSHLRIINGATRNEITLAGDTSGTLLTSDSTAILGSGNSVRYNGKSYSATLAADNDVAIVNPVDGQILTYDGASGKFKNLPGGSTAFFAGLLGDGSDGAVHLDGTATFSGITKAGSTYTLTHDLQATTLTIDSGVTLVTAGYRVFCQGAATNAGTISNDGNAGNANGTAGASTGGITIGSGKAGGAGATGNGVAGSAGGVATTNAGAGGAGSTGTAGGAGASANTGTFWYRTPQPLLAGAFSVFGAPTGPLGGSGGGGGGGDGTNKGGGGGGGGGMIVIFARSFVNTGTISAKGGAGGTPTTGNAGGGGGGAGGLIVVYTLSAWTAGTTTVTGGAAGSGVGTGSAGVVGGNGNALNFVVS